MGVIRVNLLQEYIVEDEQLNFVQADEDEKGG